MISNAHESDTGAKSTDAERSVRKYLDSFLKKPSSPTSKCHSSCYFDLFELNRALAPDTDYGGVGASFDRVVCCNSSRSLYCEECCRLLVPDHSLPIPISCSRRRKIIEEGTKKKLDEHSDGSRPLRLPFNLDIILDDRRGSATGLHAVALLEGSQDNSRTEDANADNNPNSNSSSDSSFDLGAVKVFDLGNGDKIPSYRQEDDSSTTFLLFPSPDSVPLESVASKVKTLVVLDCKWTKSGISRKNEELSTLKKVHLSSPPQETYYWRWHNAGDGMISTIEAIFYAAFEVSQLKYQKLLLESQQKISQMEQAENFLIDQKNLIHLLWLFGHQRAATLKSAQKEGTPAPCSDEGKKMQRETRKQKGTWRQLRHKEDERRLREKNALKEEKKEPTV